jgi:formate--tetrahydrofolate ligase
VRALKAHSGRFRVVAGKPLPAGLTTEDLDALRAGLCNLEKQIENVRKHGLPVVVAINRFPTDTEAELALIRDAALGYGVADAVVHELHARGAEGGEALAAAVVRAAEGPSDFHFLYPDEMPITQKIETIAKEIYGADGIAVLPPAAKQIAQYEAWGYGKLPVCMAKTHLSLSDDASKFGRPTGFRVPVREVRLSAGAGFLYALCGTMMTMPGLPTHPAGENVDIGEDGRITGLF